LIFDFPIKNQSLRIQLLTLRVLVSDTSGDNSLADSLSIQILFYSNMATALMHKIASRTLTDYWLDCLKSSPRQFSIDNLKGLVRLLNDIYLKKSVESIQACKQLLGKISNSNFAKVPEYLIDAGNIYILSLIY
jgi:hypothetical protein